MVRSVRRIYRNRCKVSLQVQEEATICIGGLCGQRQTIMDGFVRFHFNDRDQHKYVLNALGYFNRRRRYHYRQVSPGNDK